MPCVGEIIDAFGVQAFNAQCEYSFGTRHSAWRCWPNGDCIMAQAVLAHVMPADRSACSKYMAYSIAKKPVIVV